MICAHYQADSDRISIWWTDPKYGSYALGLRTEGSDQWNIYYGGHPIEYAEVVFDAFNLTGDETLVGRFMKYTLDISLASETLAFTIELSDRDRSMHASSPILCESLPGSVSTLDPTANPTAPNDLTAHLSGDFTDSDGDGMTDVAEFKYGFDPDDSLSFPTEPALTAGAYHHPIEYSDIGLYYQVDSGRIYIRWTNPEDGSYRLSLRTGDSTDWNIYHGGHKKGLAVVELSAFGLTGDEKLVGQFAEYAAGNSRVRLHPFFVLDLSTVEIPAPSILGDPSNRISYTFSNDFPMEAEAQYREFLKRVFPLLYEHLGHPAETLNVLVDYVDYDLGGFLVLDDGRTLLTDAGFIPRLIVHEFAHAWKGRYLISSDEDWNYDDSLNGFEEGTAEGMAFEIIHEYVRSYPEDPASIQLLEERPYQYWSSNTINYDAIKHLRWTGGGDFWNPPSGATNRYSIVATTVQMMVEENPTFMREFMALYYEAIREDPDWRPNRDDLIGMWEAVVPELNGHPLSEYLDALPVFNGRHLDEGVYVLEAIRPYGEIGDQQFAVAYALPDGRLWWGISEDALEEIPEWVRTSPGEEGKHFIDTQGSRFVVEVIDASGREYATYNFETEWDRYPDGSPTGFGWYYADELAMENFPVGLYKETVTFTDYVQHDEGARDSFYFFGLKDLDQNRGREYVIMIGVDGVAEGTARIDIFGEEHRAPISNGVAVFRSWEWPLDMQGRFLITVTNAEGDSRSYFRTLIEAGTLHSYFQHQFIIVDTDFNGIEDQFE